MLPYKLGTTFLCSACLKEDKTRSNTFLSSAIPSLTLLSMLQQADKRKAESFKSALCQNLHSVTHPGKLGFAVATVLSLIGTLLLALGAFDPLCRCAFALFEIA